MKNLIYHSKILLFVGMVAIMPTNVFAKKDADTQLLIQKIYDYPKSLYPLDKDTIVSNTYIKYNIDTQQRNVLLWLIPNMYPYAKDKKKKNVGESYNRATYYFKNGDDIHFDIEPYVAIKTNSHGTTDGVKAVMTYISPFIYNECLISEHLLSPFNETNRKYYKYETSNTNGDITTIHFKPFRKNTQLVSGLAEVNNKSGQVMTCEFYFEYDMMSMVMTVTQGREGIRSLLPNICYIKSRFSILGNKQKCMYMALYDQSPEFDEDEINTADKQAVISKNRPIELSAWEKEVYAEYDKVQNEQDTAHVGKKNKYRQWIDDVGENMVKTQHVEVGNTNMSLSPIANIFGFDYSRRRGLSYSMEANLNYNISQNKSLSLCPEFGINFKIPQFFYKIPLSFIYNRKKEGKLTLEVANGNRIVNSSIIDDIKTTGIIPEISDQDLFKNFTLQISNTNRIAHNVNMTIGANYYRRIAVDEDFYRLYDKPSRFYTFAPNIQVDYRFWDRGPLLSINYEQGIEAFGCDIKYSRFEADGKWKINLNKLRILSLRLGTGTFFNRSQTYFVEYKNFHENNLPERWHDEWSGNFQLLNSQYYNISKYYVRANATYESPLIFLYRLPLVGQYMEAERAYLNILTVEDLHPYVEIGYGFTNRLFSCAVYTNMIHGKFDEIGFNLTLELFDEW
ncbi:MAG: hypothetical protein KBS65_07215 [Prevotella sp.]|nr:hypothetical protein [Candidatus Equicola stercoris]